MPLKRHAYRATMRRIVLAAAIPVLCTCSVAQASPFVRYGVQDDAWLSYGPGTLSDRLDRLDALGVDVVRVTIDWRGGGKRQGAAEWPRYHAPLKGRHARGLPPRVPPSGAPRRGDERARP